MQSRRNGILCLGYSFASHFKLISLGALGGGKFKTEEQVKDYESKGEKTRNHAMRGTVIDDKTKKIVQVLDKLAKEKNSTITGIALAYVLQKVWKEEIILMKRLLTSSQLLEEEKSHI